MLLGTVNNSDAVDGPGAVGDVQYVRLIIQVRLMAQVLLVILVRLIILVLLMIQ